MEMVTFDWILGLRKISATVATTKSCVDKSHNGKGSYFHCNIIRKQLFEIMRLLHILDIPFH